MQVEVLGPQVTHINVPVGGKVRTVALLLPKLLHEGASPHDGLLEPEGGLEPDGLHRCGPLGKRRPERLQGRGVFARRLARYLASMRERGLLQQRAQCNVDFSVGQDAETVPSMEACATLEVLERRHLAAKDPAE